MKIITMTLYNRPNYTSQVLHSLEKCDGIKEYMILPSIEPVNKEVIKLGTTISFTKSLPLVHKTKQGCGKNTFLAMKRGFEISDFVLHIEDDTVLAPDSLRYIEHCRRLFEGNPAVFDISLCSRVIDWTQDDFYKLKRRNWFTPWGWATWKYRWKELEEKWDFDDSKGGWDINIGKNVIGRRLEIFPTVSRTQNIGALNGTHVPSAEWHRKNHFIEKWAGDQKVDSSGWRNLLADRLARQSLPITKIVDEAKKIDGWMSDVELEWLAKEASLRRIIVEVGSWKGRSTKALAMATPGVIYAIDHWLGSENERVDGHKEAVMIGQKEMINTFKKNLEPEFSIGKVVPLVCDSSNGPKLMQAVGIRSIGMVFIDGNHTYESVKKDISSWKELVPSGGLICGHDYHESWPGVIKAVNEAFGGRHSIAKNTTIWFITKP